MSGSGTSNQHAAQNLLMLGLNVTSTATPALDGTYAAAGVIEGPLQDQCNAILLNNAFADGTQALAWPDNGGTVHTFDVAQFKTFLSAIYQFRAQCHEWGAGTTTSAPSGSATIP